jgi:hypothetical protein
LSFRKSVAYIRSPFGKGKCGGLKTLSGKSTVNAARYPFGPKNDFKKRIRGDV